MPTSLYSIAGISIALEAEPYLIPRPMGDFAVSQNNPLLHWSIFASPAGFTPGGRMLVDSPQSRVWQGEDGVLFVAMPPFRLLAGMELTKTELRLFIDPVQLSSGCPAHVLDPVAYALETAFFYQARSLGFLALHSVSLIYEGKAYLFLAQSGVGKSTHARLWQEHFPGKTEILDGDVTLCGFSGETPTAWGLPWCGTSGDYENRSVPLGGFVFLQRGKENKAAPLPFPQSLLHLLARAFSPSWDKSMAAENMNLCQALIEKVPAYLLLCRPDQGAVEAIAERLF